VSILLLSCRYLYLSAPQRKKPSWPIAVSCLLCRDFFCFSSRGSLLLSHQAPKHSLVFSYGPASTDSLSFFALRFFCSLPAPCTRLKVGGVVHFDHEFAPGCAFLFSRHLFFPHYFSFSNADNPVAPFSLKVTQYFFPPLTSNFSLLFRAAAFFSFF